MSKFVRHAKNPKYVTAGVVWQAWAIEHNSHGLVLDTLCFMPAGEGPETDKNWVRVPWLDPKKTNVAALFEPRPKHGDCERCEGTGTARQLGKYRDCPDCRGTGKRG